MTDENREVPENTDDNQTRKQEVQELLDEVAKRIDEYGE